MIYTNCIGIGNVIGFAVVEKVIRLRRHWAAPSLGYAVIGFAVIRLRIIGFASLASRHWLRVIGFASLASRHWEGHYASPSLGRLLALTLSV